MKHCLIAAALLSCACRRSAPEASGFRTEAGFRVEAVAPAFGAASVFTFDAAGRLVAAKESGHPMLLPNATPVTTKLISPRALWFDGRTLHAVAKDEAGVSGFYRVGEGIEQLSTASIAGPIARGPEGSILSLTGGLSRWDPDRRLFVPISTGIDGVAFAHDDAGEAFVLEPARGGHPDLPGYRPPRIVHAVAGALRDELPALSELGEERPVGLVFYRHHVYPREFDGALFHGDSATGRILASTLVRDGATYRVTGSRAFVDGARGLNGLDVGPDGFLYFSSAAGIHRVRYEPSFWNRWFGAREPEGALAVARQPQPLSSWGHAALEKAKETMGPRWGEQIEQLAVDKGAEPTDRARALLLLQRFGPEPNADRIRTCAGDRSATVRGAAVWVAGRQRGARARAIAATALKDVDPFVRRRAAEAVVRLGLTPEEPPFAALDDVWALLRDGGPFVRNAGRLALERIAPAEWSARVFAETDPDAALEGLAALVRLRSADAEQQYPIFDRLLALMRRGDLTGPALQGVLRLFLTASAAEPGGASASLRKQVSDILLPRFPTQDAATERELARVLGYCGQPEAVAKILAAIPQNDSGKTRQIHFIASLAVSKDAWSAEQREAVITWFAKAARWGGVTNELAKMFQETVDGFDEGQKQSAYATVPGLAPKGKR